MIKNCASRWSFTKKQYNELSRQRSREANLRIMVWANLMGVACACYEGALPCKDNEKYYRNCGLVSLHEHFSKFCKQFSVLHTSIYVTQILPSVPLTHGDKDIASIVNFDYFLDKIFIQ